MHRSQALAKQRQQGGGPQVTLTRLLLRVHRLVKREREWEWDLRVLSPAIEIEKGLCEPMR